MKLPCKSRTTTNGNMKKKNKLDKTYSLNNGNRSIHLIEVFNNQYNSRRIVYL